MSKGYRTSGFYESTHQLETAQVICRSMHVALHPEEADALSMCLYLGSLHMRPDEALEPSGASLESVDFQTTVRLNYLKECLSKWPLEDTGGATQLR